jgi:hypothetical protein
MFSQTADTEKDVDPGEWFFKAHFFQDPVMPGSLGIEALCQLLQWYMAERGIGADLLGAGRTEGQSSGRPTTAAPATAGWASNSLDTPWLRAATSYPDMAGSGDKQAKAELCCIEVDEIAVAFCPPT